MYEFTITRYSTEIGIAEEQEEGVSEHWIGYDGILHSAGDILDISLPCREAGGSRAWTTEPGIWDIQDGEKEDRRQTCIGSYAPFPIRD